jgi:signal transduction histidine kinase
VAAAFLLVRGPFERIRSLPLGAGCVIGVLGVSEAVFPAARFPYASHTLAVAFAAYWSGSRSAVIVLALVALAAAGVEGLTIASVTTGQMMLVLGSVALAQRVHRRIAGAMAGLAIGQTLAVALAIGLSVVRPESLSSWLTIPANVLGLFLLSLVVQDARIRSDSEANRQEAAELRAVAAQAQLATVRSRVQPHFLFNALNSIAGLCLIAPDRASAFAVKLGSIMRRALEVDFGTTVSLKDELESVLAHLGIERERMGERIRWTIEVKEFADLPLPAFSLQILVENAVIHGIAKEPAGGVIEVCARSTAKGVLLAVADSGPGIEPTTAFSPHHGLGIVRAQLRLMYGTTGRLHVVPRLKGGTLAVMRLPDNRVEVKPRVPKRTRARGLAGRISG